MPNGIRWPVKMKERPSGLYFDEGWADFVYRVHLHNGDTLNLIYVGGGVFHIDRYNFMSGCIPTHDFESGDAAEDSDPEADIDSLDEWFLSDQEDDSMEGSDIELEISTSIPLPTFAISMTRTLKKNHLMIPNEYWVTHIAKDGHQFEALFTIQYRTWKMRVTKQNDSYLVHGGWLRFIRDNNIKIGARCVFQLVDAREINFRVTLMHTG